MYGDSERRAAAASCWKAALLNDPLLVHLVDISASQQETSVFVWFCLVWFSLVWFGFGF